MASTSIKFAGGVSGKDARALADEMHSESEFLQVMRKRKTETEFACYVRSLTPQAVAVTVPLGYVENQSKLTDDEYRLLITRNRARHCVPLEEALRAERDGLVHSEKPKAAPATTRKPATPATPEPAPAPNNPSRERSSLKAAPPGKKSVIEPEPTVVGAPVRSVSLREPSKTPAARTPTPPAPSPLGRGGKQHQYLQHLIKTVAETNGWRAVIEELILEGTGRVDVLLSRSNRRIACEISVTTSRDHELGNVEKCLAAGFDEIILLSTNQRQRQMLQKYISGALDDADQPKVKFLIPDEMLEYLAAQEPPTEQMIRGYRVKVSTQAIDPNEAATKRQTIASVIARSLRQSENI